MTLKTKYSVDLLYLGNMGKGPIQKRCTSSLGPMIHCRVCAPAMDIVSKLNIIYAIPRFYVDVR